MKTLKDWKKEIDEGIKIGQLDFKNGNFYESNDDFFNSIKEEVILERKNNKMNFLFANKKEGVLA